MSLNKRGAALFQVLIITALLAGMSAMILRLSLSRTIASRKARHVIAAQSVIESCMAQVNAVWAAKTPEAYARDLAACQMCDPIKDGSANCSAENQANKKYTCTGIQAVDDDDVTYTVTAEMDESEQGAGKPPCKITYYVTADDNKDARQTL